jgi:phosphoribosyl-AMP cyclohydrolase
MNEFDFPQLQFNQQGLIPAVIQDAQSRQVLMVGWMNPQALTATFSSGQVHFWSRSRQKLWRKGETSGNVLEFVEARQDCDGDSLLILAVPAGPTCHTGHESCFYTELEAPDAG